LQTQLFLGPREWSLRTTSSPRTTHDIHTAYPVMRLRSSRDACGTMAQRSSRQLSVGRNCCLKINLKTQMLRDVIEIRWNFSSFMVEPSKVRAWTMWAVTWGPKTRHRQSMLPWRSRSDDHGMLLILVRFVAWCKVLGDIPFEVGSWHMPFGLRSRETCDAEGWHVFGKTRLRIGIPRLSSRSSVLSDSSINCD
jgi:hypothetical protein